MIFHTIKLLLEQFARDETTGWDWIRTAFETGWDLEVNGNMRDVCWTRPGFGVITPRLQRGVVYWVGNAPSGKVGPPMDSPLACMTWLEMEKANAPSPTQPSVDAPAYAPPPPWSSAPPPPGMTQVQAQAIYSGLAGGLGQENPAAVTSVSDGTAGRALKALIKPAAPR